VVAIVHNVKDFDLLYVLNRLVRMKSLASLLIMNGHIICLKVENVTWLEGLKYLAMSLRKLPEAFGLGPEIAVTSFLQHYREHEVCGSRTRSLVLRCGSNARV
jgi:hypothetical protein